VKYLILLPKTSNAEYWNGTIPWFSVGDIPKEGLFVIDSEKKITQQGLDFSSTQLLPIDTTIITARGTVGKCCLVGVPLTMNQSCYALKSRADFHNYFVYYSVYQQAPNLQKSGHGTVFNTITRDTFNTVFIPIPPSEITILWGEIIVPIMSKILSNQFESRTLSQLRDMLLPNLMSGQIDV
jgi:type I restriction enzyme S subunit